MDYFLKASAILGIFYLIYKLFLQGETFFQSNRLFLLIGMFAALLLPFLVIPIYVQEQLMTYQEFTSYNNAEIIEVEPSIDWVYILKILYISGVLFFSGKFMISLRSLFKLIIRSSKEKTSDFYIIKSNTNSLPFSFFKYIVYNPTSYKKQELEQLLTHEKVHAYQWHSMDVLLSQMTTIIFWFNPFSWLYKKEIQQNLEFIADAISQEKSLCEKSYQKLLLKASVSTNQLAFTNNFYNSLIKKRIIMLHKNRSNAINQWKFALILPLITVFIFAFNTKLIAQTPEIIEVKELKSTDAKTKVKENDAVKTTSTVVEVVEVRKNHEVYIITKDTEDLDGLKDKLAKNGVTLKIKGLKRNASGEITAIKIDAKSVKASASFSFNSESPIQPIKIAISDAGNNINIGNSNIHKVHDIHFITKDGKHKKHEIKKEGLHEVIEIKTDTDHDRDIIIREEKKGKKNSIKIELSNKEDHPLIIIDGKEISYEKLEELDSDKFHSINIIKGEKASKLYGKKATNGVIEIISKKN